MEAGLSHELAQARNLVGAITINDLKYVDWYVSDDMGIFVPSVGHCGYALQHQHTHPAYSIVVITGENNGVLASPLQVDQDHYLAAMLSPHVPHEEKAGDTFSRYIALFASENLVKQVCRSCDCKLPHYPHWNQFSLPKTIMPLLTRFMTESDAKKPGYQVILQSIALVIIHDFIRFSCGGLDRRKTCHDTGIQGAVDHIHQYYHQPIPISRLAKVANMSMTTFSRRFKQHTGQSPGSYLIKARLEKARKLMRNSRESITDIALGCGFSNTAHMTTQFKMHYGITPSAYRTLYGNDAFL